DGVIATDRERGFLIFNPAAEQILGPRQPGAKPEDWSTAYGLYQEDGVTPFPIEDLPISRAVRGESTNDVELVVREPARGCDAWVRVTGRPLRDATGVISGGVVVFSEVTAAKLAELQMRDLNGQLTSRTRELESANREMQAFSYSISHDLRAPLRAIDGFSRVLLQDCADQLDDVGKRHLGRVCAATQRMSALIDALLGLARISHGGMELRRVDLSGLADEIAAELGAGESGRSVAFTIARGLEAVGDQRLLRAALENLIGNAWKFTSRRKAARIEVGSERHGGETAYFVRDDGVGFDMRHAKRLFSAFQRMHSVGDFDGTGIGLATVARIVSRHGGRIWAEAEVERGATFWFTLAAGERPPTQ
ncbi:MAG TPA: ATP-binding protein, partial [Myxococcota bacterium]|nr:ATP-binding protein [Myxococcota bacterium]